MNRTEIADTILTAFAEEEGVDISDCDEFYDKVEVVEGYVENHDSLSFSTEIEIEITATFRSGIDIDTMLWDEWFEHTETQLTVDIADDGFSRQADVQSVTLKNILDW